MTWFKVDDKLHSHPKPNLAGLRAMGLWVLAGSWSSAHLTDGFIPRHVLRMLSAKPQDARDLVRSGLWVDETDGWRFHDWHQSNPTRDDVEEQREEWANRQRLARERRKAATVTPTSQDDVTRDSRVTHDGVTLQASQHPVPSRPDPTRPTTTERGQIVEPGTMLAIVVDSPTPADAVAPTTKRGTRINDDWEPARNTANTAAEQGHSPDTLLLELARFRDYWAAMPGQKGTKLDWDATWRNWIRRATDYAPKKPQATMGSIDWRTA